MAGQFALIPAKVLYDENLPATAKLLYGEIYRLSHANGYCYASNQDFVKLLDRSPSTIGDLLKALSSGGYIRVRMIRRYGSTGDVVQRRIFIGQTLAPENEEDGYGGIPENRYTSTGESGDGIPENREDTTKRKNKRNTPISPKEILDEATSYAGGNLDLLAALMGFLEMRSKKKIPVDTIRGLHLITCKLDKEAKGSVAVKIAMLDNATVHKWAKVYPLKPDEMPEAVPDDDEEGIDGI